MESKREAQGKFNVILEWDGREPVQQLVSKCSAIISPVNCADMKKSL
jgi:hypothetical protein